MTNNKLLFYYNNFTIIKCSADRSVMEKLVLLLLFLLKLILFLPMNSLYTNQIKHLYFAGEDLVPESAGAREKRQTHR